MTIAFLGNVIPGWDMGVATMRKGELARFLVGPPYAFGLFGCPPRIPPDATGEWVLSAVIYTPKWDYLSN